jgi:hypothetical protein
MTTDPDEFEKQLLFCHTRLLVAYGCFPEPIDPEAALGALMWLLCDMLLTFPHDRRLMEIRRIGVTLNDICAGTSRARRTLRSPTLSISAACSCFTGA